MFSSASMGCRPGLTHGYSLSPSAPAAGTKPHRPAAHAPDLDLSPGGGKARGQVPASLAPGEASSRLGGQPPSPGPTPGRLLWLLLLEGH